LDGFGNGTKNVWYNNHEVMVMVIRDGDTIAAIATAPGDCGIGIVRISGPKSIDIARAIFKPVGRKVIEFLPDRRMHYGFIMDPETGRKIDEVLMVAMKAPNTYTREDVVEIDCHGGSVPLRNILSIVVNNGARVAEPGEFTKRAFLNGQD
jgi:tRNA modification GTPase